MTKLKGTDPALAKKIMGADFISLDEALSIFPSPPEYLDNLETIPFSPGMLYECSEPKNRHILLPGLYRVGKQPLTLTNMRGAFPEHRKYFGQWDGLVTSVVSSLTRNTCPDQWHLISTKTFSLPELQKYCLYQDIGKEDICGTFLTAYAYAWLLTKRLRGESIFTDRAFYCIDKPSFGNYHVSLRCSENEIKILPFPMTNQRYFSELEFVPVILPEPEI